MLGHLYFTPHFPACTHLPHACSARGNLRRAMGGRCEGAGGPPAFHTFAGSSDHVVQHPRRPVRRQYVRSGGECGRKRGACVGGGAVSVAQGVDCVFPNSSHTFFTPLSSHPCIPTRTRCCSTTAQPPTLTLSTASSWWFRRLCGTTLTSSVCRKLMKGRSRSTSSHTFPHTVSRAAGPCVRVLACMSAWEQQGNRGGSWGRRQGGGPGSGPT